MRWIFPTQIGLFIFSLVLGLQTFAAQTGDVVMNEIAWMGTIESYNNEWVELYNTAQSDINLDGWVLRSTDGIPTVNLSGVIAANSYFLLERTDDNTVSAQIADQIYTGALGNSGEHLELVGNNGVVTDNVNSWGNWFAGDNTTKQTMERKNPLLPGPDASNWATSISTGGTPKAQNSVFTVPQPAPSPQSQIPEQNSTTSEVSPNQQEDQIPTSTTTSPSPSPPPPPSLSTPTPEIPTLTPPPKITTPTPPLQKKKAEPVTENVPARSGSALGEKTKEPPAATTSPATTRAEAERQNTSTTPHTASVAESATPRNQNLVTILSASFLALISAAFIFVLKKRLAK